MNRILTFTCFCLLFGGISAQKVWESLPGGGSGLVHGILADERTDLLYLYGKIDQAGDARSTWVAAFDGGEWKGLGSWIDLGGQVIPGECVSLVQYRGDLVATLMFGEEWGTSTFFEVARWDGDEWHSLGRMGERARVKVMDDRLYAIGNLGWIEGEPMHGPGAWWDGERWHAITPVSVLDSGIYGDINDYVIFKGNPIVAGWYSEVNELYLMQRWDGTDWVKVHDGSTFGFRQIHDIVEYRGLLFVAGYFRESDGCAADHVMAWDGENWINPFPEAHFEGPRHLTVDNGKLYIYSYVDAWGAGEHGHARYDGNYLCSFGYPSEYVTGMCEWRGDLYASGSGFAFANYQVGFENAGKWVGGEDAEDCIFQPLPVKYLVSDAETITAFPNPTDDYFSFQLPHGAMRCEYTLYDATGRRLIAPHSWSLGERPVDLSRLSPGTYLVQVTVGERREFIREIRN